MFVLILIALIGLVDIISIIFTQLCSRNVPFLTVIPELIAVIIFPIKYNEELKGEDWFVGWSYVVAVLSAGLVLIAAIFLCVDRGADEALIREKTCYYNDESIEETLE